MNTPLVVSLALAAGIVLDSNLTLRIMLLADADRMRTGVLRWAPVLSAAACVSVFSARSGFDTVLVIPWLLATLTLFLARAGEFVRLNHMRGSLSLINVFASAYLVVGAAFLLIWRVGGHPSGLSDTVVELTAVHYHFAGFAALVLASRCVAALPSDSRARQIALTSTGLIALASPLIAIGFVVNVHFLAVGAVVMVIGVLGMAAVTFWRVAPTLHGRARLLLRISSASVVISMALALDYGLSQVLPIPALTIDEMAITHGLINAVLFIGCGLTAWLVVDRASAGDPK